MYKVSTNYRSKHRKRSEDSVKKALQETMMMGVPGMEGSSPLDDQFKSSIEYAKELMKKMKLDLEN